MRKSVHSATLGDLVEDAMRRHFAEDAIDLGRAKRIVFWVSGSCFAGAIVLFIWGITR